MDSFEEYIRQATIDWVENVNLDRMSIAQSRIQYFAATLYHLLVEKQESFDLIFATGNSGLYMLEIANMVYAQLDLEEPPSFVFPVYRETKEIPVRHEELLVDMQYFPIDIHAANILFVDDEIRRGKSLQTGLNLLVEAYGDPTKPVTCTVVAENHFFEWRFQKPKVSLSFYSYARCLPGYIHNIAHIVPEELFEEVKCITNAASVHEAFSMVVGGGVKCLVGNIPCFDSEFEQLLEQNLSAYMAKKEHLLSTVDEQVQYAIERYKTGQIILK